jgi:hypothetical protein
MGFWNWNKKLRRYQKTAEGAAALGGKAGDIIGHSQMIRLRDGYNANLAERVISVSAGLAEGGSLTGWVNVMRENIKNAYINQYMLAMGGRNNMKPADWGRVGAEIKKQYRFLNQFANEIANGQLSEKQIANRAKMYIDGSTQLFERANVIARGMPDLPEYPADGGQKCKSKCKCNWRIVETETGWDCYWELEEGAEHCEDCLANAATYNPLTIRK